MPFTLRDVSYRPAVFWMCCRFCQNGCFCVRMLCVGIWGIWCSGVKSKSHRFSPKENNLTSPVSLFFFSDPPSRCVHGSRGDPGYYSVSRSGWMYALSGRGPAVFALCVWKGCGARPPTALIYFNPFTMRGPVNPSIERWALSCNSTDPCLSLHGDRKSTFLQGATQQNMCSSASIHSAPPLTFAVPQCNYGKCWNLVISLLCTSVFNNYHTAVCSYVYLCKKICLLVGSRAETTLF